MTPYYDEAGVTIWNADARSVDLPGDVMVTDPPYGIDYDSGKPLRLGQGVLL